MPLSMSLQPCQGMNYRLSWGLSVVEFSLIQKSLSSDRSLSSQISFQVQVGSQWPGLFCCGVSAADGSVLATCHYCSVPVNKMSCKPGCSGRRHRQNTLGKPINHCWMWRPRALGLDFSLSREENMHNTITLRPREENDQSKHMLRIALTFLTILYDLFNLFISSPLLICSCCSEYVHTCRDDIVLVFRPTTLQF